MAFIKLLIATSRLLLLNLIPSLAPFEICLRGFTVLCPSVIFCVQSPSSHYLRMEALTHSCHLHSITTAPRNPLFLKFSFSLCYISPISSCKYTQISPTIKENITSYTVVPSLGTVLYLFVLKTNFLKQKPRLAISGFLFSGHSSVPCNLGFAPIKLFLPKYQ